MGARASSIIRAFFFGTGGAEKWTPGTYQQYWQMGHSAGLEIAG